MQRAVHPSASSLPFNLSPASVSFSLSLSRARLLFLPYPGVQLYRAPAQLPRGGGPLAAMAPGPRALLHHLPGGRPSGLHCQESGDRQGKWQAQNGMGRSRRIIRQMMRQCATPMTELCPKIRHALNETLALVLPTTPLQPGFCCLMSRARCQRSNL